MKQIPGPGGWIEGGGGMGFIDGWGFNMIDDWNGFIDGWEGITGD